MAAQSPMAAFKGKKKRSHEGFSMERFMSVMFLQEVDVAGEADTIESLHTEILYTDNYDYMLQLGAFGKHLTFDMKRVVYKEISENGRQVNANAVSAARVEFFRHDGVVVPCFFQADDVDLNMAGVMNLAGLLNFVEKRRKPDKGEMFPYTGLSIIG